MRIDRFFATFRRPAHHHAPRHGRRVLRAELMVKFWISRIQTSVSASSAEWSISSKIVPKTVYLLRSERAPRRQGAHLGKHCVKRHWGEWIPCLRRKTGDEPITCLPFLLVSRLGRFAQSLAWSSCVQISWPPLVAFLPAPGIALLFGVLRGRRASPRLFSYRAQDIIRAFPGRHEIEVAEIWGRLNGS